MGGMDTTNAPATVVTPSFQRGAHVIALPPVAEGSALPAWVEMIPAGQFSGRDGRGPYRADFAAIQQTFAAWRMPIPGDYEHQSLNTVDNGQPAPASGWGYEFDERNGAVWCRVEWNERAAVMIAAKEYRYLSPVFDYYPDGTIFRITGFALTNNPNLFLTAVARREAGGFSQEAHTMPGPLDKERANEILDSIIYRLNLPVTSTPKEVQAAFSRVVDSLAATQAAMTQIRTALGVPAEADTTAIITAAQSRLSSTSPNPGEFVPRAEFDRVSHTLASIQTERETDRVEATVSAAMTAGKVTPGMADWARSYCRADAAGFANWASVAPVLAPGGGNSASHTTIRPPSDSTTNPLLADAESRCK
jgi:phage I-like protein